MLNKLKVMVGLTFKISIWVFNSKETSMVASSRPTNHDTFFPIFNMDEKWRMVDKFHPLWT
jgi:hypothetical protein